MFGDHLLCFFVGGIPTARKQQICYCRIETSTLHLLLEETVAREASRMKWVSYKLLFCICMVRVPFACCANLRPAPLWPEDKGDPAPVPLCPLDSLTPFPRRGCGPGPRGLWGYAYRGIRRGEACLALVFLTAIAAKQPHGDHWFAIVQPEGRACPAPTETKIYPLPAPGLRSRTPGIVLLRTRSFLPS